MSGMNDVEMGAPCAWLVAADPNCPEFADVHWGEVSGQDGDEVQITDLGTDEVFWMLADQVPYVPGYEPRPRSVWD